MRLHTKLSKHHRRDKVIDLLRRVGAFASNRQSIPTPNRYRVSGSAWGAARAIATEPRFMVLDKFRSGLYDPTARAEIIDLLIDLQDRTGITYLFISHDLMTVRYLCNWVAVMYLGKMVDEYDGRVVRNPVHPYTRALLSAIPVPDPDFKRAKFVLEGEIPSPMKPPDRMRPACALSFRGACMSHHGSMARRDQNPALGFVHSLGAWFKRLGVASRGGIRRGYL